MAMQLARLRDPAPSSLREKLKQIIAAERFAIRTSKRDLLEQYVNRVPMGGNLYGVEAAARTYFGVPASDLDLAQASLLAAFPNDPTRLAPDVDFTALRARQRYVLARMTALHAIRKPSRGGPSPKRCTCGGTIRGSPQPHTRSSSSTPSVPAGAGRVRTTIDRPLQRSWRPRRASVSERSPRITCATPPRSSSTIVPATVLAYVGSPDYFSTTRRWAATTA